MKFGNLRFNDYDLDFLEFNEQFLPTFLWKAMLVFGTLCSDMGFIHVHSNDVTVSRAHSPFTQIRLGAHPQHLNFPSADYHICLPGIIWPTRDIEDRQLAMYVDLWINLYSKKLQSNPDKVLASVLCLLYQDDDFIRFDPFMTFFGRNRA